MPKSVALLPPLSTIFRAMSIPWISSRMQALSTMDLTSAFPPNCQVRPSAGKQVSFVATKNVFFFRITERPGQPCLFSPLGPVHMVKNGHKYVIILQINVPRVMILSQKLGKCIWQWGTFIWDWLEAKRLFLSDVVSFLYRIFSWNCSVRKHYWLKH